MPEFSKRSKDILATCDPRIIEICNDAIKVTDFSVICGHRGQEEQDKAYKDGFSGVSWPNSRHNTSPSTAVDLAPYPIDWDDTKRFHYLAGVMMACATLKGYNLTWGGLWKRKDLPHYQIEGIKLRIERRV